MSPEIVIACFRPKPGKEADLLSVVKEHQPILRKEGLVTDRLPIVMRAKDGTIIEVFEWKSAEAIESAHKNPNVLAMWGRFEACCTYHPVSDILESKELFAGFDPVNF